MTHPKAKGQVARARASITIVDVARLAGVNPSTVSRALSGSPAVTPQTRARIAEIARESGYVANHNARMLRSRKSNQILVIVPNIAAFSHPDVILGIEEALEEHNIGVIVGSTKGSEEREVALARHLITGTADGLILLNGRLPSELGELPQYTRRIVAISRPIANPAIAFVGIDNEKAAIEATQYLLSLGRSRILHMAGPEQSPIFTARAQGYRNAMRQAGLHEHSEVQHLCLFDISAGREAMRSILSRRHLPDAILCASDELAFGAIQVAKEHRIKVPEQIAFIGFDNHPVSEAFSPPLTTISIPRRRLGFLGAQTLLRLIGGDRAIPEAQLLPYEFLARASCGQNYMAARGLPATYNSAEPFINPRS
ncbi:LacI family transcriptional regulator [Rhizobium leguminosarum]|uniref:LacI family transcriptional regulator n=1 Tax=Rhizobium leguminosarum TaxID=384 RepID=A0AAJ1AEJ2_RHILE|nr:MULTISPECIES: LacI family DNA-binding transcriptional regulator [Rhizobium]MBY3134519.1 LacI family transcriptional regulator [Rhizobium laguerreae]MBY3158426.1 LacI family transcriptional regulator [Rhizobium laguerreae]MBY3446052.1 LacI family transcriptional regulator [Rhizobium laguerreae]MBY5537547.1 LacI family transcriptional regulator [Rhizobium leguminosarum]MBY5545149.1 LacI family transcriptional regulator [Rhizobium leguminosarum]